MRNAMKTAIRVSLAIIAALLIFASFSLLLAFLTRALWNNGFVPAIDSANEIGYWPAYYITLAVMWLRGTKAPDTDK